MSYTTCRMRLTLDASLQVTWILAGMVWLAGWLSGKRTREAEAQPTRYVHLTLIVTAFSLLFSKSLRVGVLGIHLVPGTAPMHESGLVLTIAGVLFAIWGRASLGGN